MAFAIAMVRIVPLAPTRVPAISSSTFASTRPDAATASPVKALSSEITIGTSAPPIGSTSSTPRARPDGGEEVGEQRVAGRDERDAGGDGADHEQHHEDPQAGERHRPGRDDALELAEGDERSGERDRADEHRHGDDGEGPRALAVPDLDEGDERGRAAADAVEGGDELRHLRHLHAARGDHRDHGADRDRGEDEAEVPQLDAQHVGEHGDRRAGGAEQVRPARGARVAESPLRARMNSTAARM